MIQKEKKDIDSIEIEQCITVLNNLVKNSEQLVELPEAQRIALMMAAGRLSRPDPEEKKRRLKEKKKVTPPPPKPKPALGADLSLVSAMQFGGKPSVTVRDDRNLQADIVVVADQPVEDLRQ